MALEFSGTTVDRNQATRTLRETVVWRIRQGKGPSRMGVGRWDRWGGAGTLQQLQGRVLPGSLG